MLYPTPAEVAAVMEAKGYVLFDQEGKGYNLNLFGIRTADDDANTFNDQVSVMYLSDGEWVIFHFPATTDPGLYWRENPMNVEGTAILQPGQYRGSHAPGSHKGYPALKQVKPVTVWRDDDKDASLDAGAKTQTGLFGINIHRANRSQKSTQVNKWSAGCQVIADPAHFEFLMDLVGLATARYGPSLTYTLLEDTDFG